MPPSLRPHLLPTCSRRRYAALVGPVRQLARYAAAQGWNDEAGLLAHVDDLTAVVEAVWGTHTAHETTRLLIDLLLTTLAADDPLAATMPALESTTPTLLLSADPTSTTSGAPPGHAREAHPRPRPMTAACRTSSRRGAGHAGPASHPAGPTGPYISPI